MASSLDISLQEFERRLTITSLRPLILAALAGKHLTPEILPGDLSEGGEGDATQQGLEALDGLRPCDAVDELEEEKTCSIF